MAQDAAGGKTVKTNEAGGARLLRIDEVAERLAISRSMAWKIVTYGQLRAVRIGRAVRVRPADLEAYIEAAAAQSE
jgi:excisionase family DNA binding protein